MIDLDYAARHLHSILRLVRGADDWREGVDLSTDGVFSSFWSMFLSIPFAILSSLTEYRMSMASGNFADSFYAKAPVAVVSIAELISTAAAWVLGIAAITYIAHQLNASRSAAELIIAYNWSQLLSFIVALIPAIAIFTTGSVQITALLFVPAIVFNYYVFWIVVRRLLPVSVMLLLSLIVGLTAAAVGIYAVIGNISISIYEFVS